MRDSSQQNPPGEGQEQGSTRPTEGAGLALPSEITSALMDHLADDLLERMVLRLEQRPDLVRRTMAIFEAEANSEKAMLTVNEYADRISVCKRTVENMIREDMPLVGKGRLRRVPVKEADAWLKARQDDGDVVEQALARDRLKRARKTSVGGSS